MLGRVRAVGHHLAMARDERVVESTMRARARMRAWVKERASACREMRAAHMLQPHLVGHEVVDPDHLSSMRVEASRPTVFQHSPDFPAAKQTQSQYRGARGIFTRRQPLCTTRAPRLKAARPAPRAEAIRPWHAGIPGVPAKSSPRGPRSEPRPRRHCDRLSNGNEIAQPCG